MNKKILMSLVVIGVVAAIVAGTTGAWWTDVATSSNTSFHSGNMDLQLANASGGPWRQNVKQTWNYSEMVPGGTPEGDSLWLRNNGSTPADWLKITTVTEPSDSNKNMDKHMRITQLAYAGKSLLTGGAGADLSGYEAPAVSDCNLIVDGDYDGDSEYGNIQGAVDAAVAGDLVCVRNRSYNETVTIGTGLTLAALHGQGATIQKGVNINSDNVAVEGFKILSTFNAGGGGTDKKAVYLGKFDNIAIEYNELDGAGESGALRGVVTEGGASYSNVSIENNVIHDLTTGIYTNPHTGIIDIKYNDFYNTVAGIGGLTDADVQFNKFHDNGEAIGTDSSTQGYTVQYNEFLNGDKVVKYGAWPLYDDGGTAIVAEKNWWGDWDPSDQVFGNVDYDPYLGGPVLGFINGNDWNDNGFADLHDFYGVTDASWGDDPIVIGDPDLQINGGNYHSLLLQVQLDGPTAENDDQGEKVKLDVTVTMGQGPAPSGN